MKKMRVFKFLIIFCIMLSFFSSVNANIVTHEGNNVVTHEGDSQTSVITAKVD